MLEIPSRRAGQAVEGEKWTKAVLKSRQTERWIEWSPDIYFQQVKRMRRQGYGMVTSDWVPAGVWLGGMGHGDMI